MSNDISLTNVPQDLMDKLIQFTKNPPKAFRIADYPEYANEQFVVNKGYADLYCYTMKHFSEDLNKIFNNTELSGKVKELYIAHTLTHDPGGLHTLHIDNGRNVGLNFTITAPSDSRFLIEENDGSIREVEIVLPHLFKADHKHGWTNNTMGERSFLSVVFTEEYDNWEIATDLLKEWF